MSHILKIALCPAPFQKPKKKGEKKKDKKLAHSPGSPFQEMLPNGLVVDTTTRSHSTSGRPSSISPRSSMSSGSPQQALRSAYSHQSDMMRAVVVPHCSNCSSSPSGPPCCRQVPAPPPYTTSYGSGYQSEYGGPSGYSGGLETQMLARATKDRPANLRMTAIRDYSPGCNEELSVRKGQRVRVLYRNHDWVFAVTKHGSSGFIPFTYVRPSRKYNGYQSEPEIARVDESYVSGYDTDATSFPFPPQQPLRQLPRTTRQPASSPQAYTINTSCRRVGSGSPVQAHVDRVFDSGYMSAVEGYYQPQTRSTPSSRYRPTTHKPSMDSFDKQFIEELVVIHDFEAKEEDEVLVRKGERVKVLNATDPNWLWVRLIGGMGEEGFIPRSCCTLGNHPSLSSPDFESSRLRRHYPSVEHVSSRRQHPAHHYARHHQFHRNMKNTARDRFKQLAVVRSVDPTSMDKEEIKKIGTKLIVLMDYEAVMEDELSVEFAETLLADVLSQNGLERIWVYCPRTDSCGYVPMSMVVPPVV